MKDEKMLNINLACRLISVITAFSFSCCFVFCFFNRTSVVDEHLSVYQVCYSDHTFYSCNKISEEQFYMV